MYSGMNEFKPTPFTGREDVEEWLDTFQRYASFANWNNERCLRALRAAMKEQAAQWLRQQQIEDYDELKEALLNKYQYKPPQIFQMRQELANMTQDKKNVNDYAELVASLCHKLNIDEDGQLHAFVKGLRNDIKKQVLRSQPSNLSEALSAATAEETAQSVAGQGSSDANVSLSPDKDSLVERVADAVVQRLSVSTLSSANVAAVHQEKSPQCQLCHAHGHVAPQCPSLYNYRAPAAPYPQAQPPPQRPRLPRSQQPRLPRSQVQCYNCQQYGHYRRECLHAYQPQGNGWGPPAPPGGRK